jgi:hypothetical protein
VEDNGEFFFETGIMRNGVGGILRFGATAYKKQQRYCKTPEH